MAMATSLAVGIVSRLRSREAIVSELRAAGIHFRNDVITGVGGKQIIVDDPSGNPVELFQPTLPEAKLGTRS